MLFFSGNEKEGREEKMKVSSGWIRLSLMGVAALAAM